MRYVGYLWLLSALFFGAPAHAKASHVCNPADTVGWVVSVSITSIGPQPEGSSPVIRSELGDEPAVAQTPICAGALVSNPTGSRRSVVVRFLGERPAPIAEGASLSAPISQLPGKLKELIDRYLRRSSAGTARGTVDASARGSACPFSAAEFQPFSFAVRGWGPLHTAWACPKEFSGIWVIGLSGKDIRPAQIESTRNEIAPYIENCNSHCMVTVEELGTNKFSYVFVVEEQSPDKANIPEDILSLPASSEKRALIGSALIRRGEYWKLQGYSMIYSAACSVPYAAIIAKEYYGFKNIDEVCAEPAKN